ncbi:hypothetical protein [Roseixanthobacter liquoris]|uniref:hypothetical protein n=1 Tax=Roseixanthobacter liquoris TaxID=3119921 RepID=UPI0037266F4E
MQLNVDVVGEGLHPSEKVVLVDTKTGPEELVLHVASVRHNLIDVGWPVGQDGEYLLVELPRQTARGISRVWVRRDLVSNSEQAA